MKKLEIFEPALCCQSGVCGAKKDSELLRITAFAGALKSNGVSIERYNLNSHPEIFANNELIKNFIDENGVGALPVGVLDGKIVFSKCYTSNDEMLDLLGLPKDFLEK